jgi:hypothetical protein
MPAERDIRNMSPSTSPRFRDIEVAMFLIDRPFTAVLAALATAALFATLDLLLQHATR